MNMCSLVYICSKSGGVLCPITYACVLQVIRTTYVRMHARTYERMNVPTRPALSLHSGAETKTLTLACEVLLPFGV